MIYPWSWRLPFLSLIAVQAVIGLPLTSYHRGLACELLMIAWLALWSSVLCWLARPASPERARLVRLTSSATLAVSPFAWYKLRYLHGCCVTFEDSPLFLGLVLFLPPLVFRQGLSYPSGPRDDDGSRWNRAQFRHFMVWLVALQIFLFQECWLGQVARDQFAWEPALLQSILAGLLSLIFWAPNVGFACIFRHSKLSPHVACFIPALLLLSALFEF